MNTKNLIKISKLAKDLNVTKATIYNWKNRGILDFVKSNTNMNFVTIETYHNLMGIKEKKNESVVIYCRVSSSVNKNNLKSQKERLINYCSAKGYKISKIVEEFGSGLNDNRPKLMKLLNDQDFSKIIIEHKDRLTRTGFNYIKTLLDKNNIEIEIINEAEDNKEDLIQDFISIITSYCARIYGQRRCKRKTERLIEELNNDKE